MTFPRPSRHMALAAGAACLMAACLLATLPGLAASAAGTPERIELAEASDPAGLPGGATSLNETYKDWRVACVQQEGLKRCVLSQVQVHQNGQRLLAFELDAPSNNTVSGTLVTPFGLALAAGIGLQIDEQPPMPALPFRTCLPGGCLVPLVFDAGLLAALHSGTTLKIGATADDGTAASFAVSLLGFGTALERVEALSR